MRSLAPRAPLLIGAALALDAGCAPAPRTFDPDAIPETYRRPTGALMRPGATRAFLVTPEGDLYNGEWVVTSLTDRAA